MLEILILLCMAITTAAIPKFIIHSDRNKCFITEAPKDTILLIRYEAPDLILDETDVNYGPTFLFVHVMPSAANGFDVKTDRRSEVLSEKEGTVVHKMEVDGLATICIRSSTASLANAMRFGLFIDRDDGEVRSSNDPLMSLDENGLDGHLSYMEEEMKRIHKQMKGLMSDAEFAKEQDAELHKQTASMHSASIFWPVVQVFVLLMTGFTQAGHITQFFQSRRII